jgi:hypothetical protein
MLYDSLLSACTINYRALKQVAATEEQHQFSLSANQSKIHLDWMLSFKKLPRASSSSSTLSLAAVCISASFMVAADCGEIATQLNDAKFKQNTNRKQPRVSTVTATAPQPLFCVLCASAHYSLHRCEQHNALCLTQQ